MDAHPLTTEPRTDRGKGAARQMRMRNKIPGVLYGPGMEPATLALAPKELNEALSGPYRRNQLLQLKLADTEHLALVRELQVHPVTRAFLHVDFYRVDPEREVEVAVPLRTQGKAKGVVSGGELRVTLRDVPVRARPTAIPAEIVVNVSELDLGDVVRGSDLPLPEGVSTTLDPHRSVVACSVPRRQKDEDEEKGAEGAAGAEGARATASSAGDAEAPAAEGEKKD